MRRNAPASKLVRSPKLYSTFLLWLLSELFESLPIARGDQKSTLDRSCAAETQDKDKPGKRTKITTTLCLQISILDSLSPGFNHILHQRLKFLILYADS